MINEVFGEAMVAFIVGVLFGILESWNKKVFFFLWVLGAAVTVIAVLIVGVSDIYTDYPWWRNLVGIFFTVVGFLGGKIFYRSAFDGN